TVRAIISQIQCRASKGLISRLESGVRRAWTAKRAIPVAQEDGKLRIMRDSCPAAHQCRVPMLVLHAAPLAGAFFLWAEAASSAQVRTRARLARGILAPRYPFGADNQTLAAVVAQILSDASAAQHTGTTRIVWVPSARERLRQLARGMPHACRALSVGADS